MKSILGIAALTFALSLCNLAGKLANMNASRNSNEESTSSTKNGPAGNENANQTETNTSSTVEPIAPPPPGMNQNSSNTNDGRTISGGVLDDKAISKPDPPYPPLAKAARASGKVTVEVTVDETGKVISAKAASGHPLLRAAAEQAARQARFKPTLLSGKAVKVTGVLTYNFQPQ